MRCISHRHTFYEESFVNPQQPFFLVFRVEAKPRRILHANASGVLSTNPAFFPPQTSRHRAAGGLRGKKCDPTFLIRITRGNPTPGCRSVPPQQQLGKSVASPTGGFVLGPGENSISRSYLLSVSVSVPGTETPQTVFARKRFVEAWPGYDPSDLRCGPVRLARRLLLTRCNFDRPDQSRRDVAVVAHVSLLDRVSARRVFATSSSPPAARNAVGA